MYQENMGKGFQEMNQEELQKTLSSFDDVKTWGFLGDPHGPSPIDSFYIVPKKPIKRPKNCDLTQGVDYKQLSCVVTSKNRSFYCCEYLYSYDEFQKTSYRGTFRLEINKANKQILEWIVSNRSLLLMNKSPKKSWVIDMEALYEFFSKTPSFQLPLHDISGLALNDDYLDLIN